MGGAKLSPLCKDVWQELHNGDMFSLLPSDLVFKVVMKEEEKKYVVVEYGEGMGGGGRGERLP